MAAVTQAPEEPRSKRARETREWSHEMHRAQTSVVQLFCEGIKPNYDRPWSYRRQESSFSTAFVLSRAERLLMTNRHCVAHSSAVEVRRGGDDRRFEATVLARGTDADLALVTVEDCTFWDDESFALSELIFSEQLPRPCAEVVCVGYPVGGDNICFTKGVVSRVDYENEDDPWLSLPVIQIDAAINPGNSGGPALLINCEGEGTCMGVAYQTLDGETENVGYIVPVCVVRKFLATWRRSVRPQQDQALRVASVGHGRFRVQKLQNPIMRQALEVSGDRSGVLVTDVDPTGPNAGILFRDDVLMSLAGVRIGNDGCTPFHGGDSSAGRAPFPWLALHAFVGDSIEATVLRRGEVVQTSIVLGPCAAQVPRDKDNPKRLEYTVFGGFVFLALSQQYLRAAFEKDWRTSRCDGLKALQEEGWHAQDRGEIVILSEVLAHKTTTGYKGMKHMALDTVSRHKEPAVPVRSLRELHAFFEELDGGVVELRFHCTKDDMRPTVAILDVDSARRAEPELLRRFKLPKSHCLNPAS